MGTTSRRKLIGAALGAASAALLAACAAPAAPTARPEPAAAPSTSKPAAPPPPAASAAASAPASAAPTTAPPAAVAAAPTTAPAAAAAAPTTAPAAAAAAPTSAPAAGTAATTGPARAYVKAPRTGVQRERMVVGVQGLPASVDPPAELSNVGTRVTYSIFDTLIRRDFLDGNKLVPALATEWRRVDETTLELKLRSGVTFHNGDPFTAEDVVYTFERLNRPEAATLAEARTYFSSFKGVQAVDPSTVRIQTRLPDPLLEQRLASWGSWIVSKKYIAAAGDAEFARRGVGTGPFKVVRFDPSNELALERHEGYWDEKPPVRQLVFRVIPENAARVTALITGEVQVITNIPPDQIKALQGASNVEIRDVPLANMHVLRYNARHPVLASEKLRQALNLGIDRKLLIDTLWGGRAVHLRGHQFEEYGPLYNASRPLTPYDPARAKALVAESGYKGDKITYRTQADYYTNGLQAGQAIVAMWKEIGFNAEILLVTAGDKEDPAQSMVANWSNSSVLADPDGCLWRSWGKDTPQQKNYWTPVDPEYNKLGDEARTSLDVKRRYDAYQKMLDVWEKEAPGTSLYAPVENYGVSKEVNWSPYPFYYMDYRAYNLSFAK